jgi:hypothetical protein
MLLTDHENTCRDLVEDAAYEEDELKYAKVQLMSLDSPDFFLRLMPAKLEKKKELAQLDRLNMAKDTLRDVRKQLKELL